MKLTKLFGLASLVFAMPLFAQQSTLTIYTYDSFASEWGAAKPLAERFEQSCQCKVQFVPFEDGITMFNRLRLEGKKSKADILLGIDQFLVPEAEKSGLFIEHNQPLDPLNLPQKWENKTFYPYDYSEYAFIYDQTKLANPPKSLQELVERQDLRLIYQDPRTSTVGRGLLLWVNQVYGEQAKTAWQTLAKHTVTVGKGWSETYGAFLKGEADMVLSYTTSPLYHQWYEKEQKYAAAPFNEGHLAQIEVAGILATSKHPDLARQFLRFLIEPESQKIIATKNIMKPVIKGEIDPALTKMPTFKSLNIPQMEQATLKQWLSEWQQAVSK